jgi:CBS domain-containing protein
MRERSVGTLVIVDGKQRPIGVITDRDVVLRVVAAARDPATTRVADVMTREPRTVSEDTPIEGALSLMMAGRFRRLPVVDRNGRLTGIVSTDDVLDLVAEELSMIRGLIAREAPHPMTGTAG